MTKKNIPLRTINVHENFKSLATMYARHFLQTSFANGSNPTINQFMPYIANQSFDKGCNVVKGLIVYSNTVDELGYLVNEFGDIIRSQDTLNSSLNFLKTLRATKNENNSITVEINQGFCITISDQYLVEIKMDMYGPREIPPNEHRFQQNMFAQESKRQENSYIQVFDTIMNKSVTELNTRQGKAGRCEFKLFEGEDKIALIKLFTFHLLDYLCKVSSVSTTFDKLLNGFLSSRFSDVGAVASNDHLAKGWHAYKLHINIGGRALYIIEYDPKAKTFYACPSSH